VGRNDATAGLEENREDRAATVFCQEVNKDVGKDSHVSCCSSEEDLSRSHRRNTKLESTRIFDEFAAQ